MVSERWLPVPGYETLYMISNIGRVKNQKEMVLKTHTDNDKAGRVRVHLSKNGKGKTFKVHTLVANAFIGPRPDGMEVCHDDGDPTNNVLTNLRYDTHSENALDMLRHGTNGMANKTHCVNDHEYTEQNTYRDKNGWRQCRICRDIKNRARYL